MAKDQWETPIPEEQRKGRLKTAKQKFCDNEINKYIADESWMADKWSKRASASLVNGLGEDFDKFRGWQQQHLDRALELEKVKTERRTARWTQRLTLLGLFATVFFGYMELKNQSNPCPLNGLIESTMSKQNNPSL